MLRGPDPEPFRTKVYGARYYVDPLPACDLAPATKDKFPAVSTIKGGWSKPFRKKLPTGETVPLDALWAAEYIADNLPAVNLLAADRAAVVQLCALAPGRRLNSKAERGTGVHSLLEDIAGGVVVDDSLLPVEVEPFAPACRGFIGDWKPVWVAAEVLCFNREVGYAGTADAIITIELDGKPFTCLVDWKSRDGDHGCYEEEVAQIGGYSAAEYLIVRSPIDGTPMRMEMPHLDGGLVVSINRDGYQPYPVDLELARDAFLNMRMSWMGLRGGQKAARKARQHPLLVPPSAGELEAQLAESIAQATWVDVTDNVVSIEVTPGKAAQEEEGDPPAADGAPAIPGPIASMPRQHADRINQMWEAAKETLAEQGFDIETGEPTVLDDPEALHAARLEWLQKRIDVIKAKGDEARAALAREWSTQDSIPTMPNGGPRTPEELEVVSGWCWTVEQQFQLKFPDPEPGTDAFIAALRRDGLISADA